jgi:hypothetical protein
LAETDLAETNLAETNLAETNLAGKNLFNRRVGALSIGCLLLGLIGLVMGGAPTQAASGGAAPYVTPTRPPPPTLAAPTPTPAPSSPAARPGGLIWLRVHFADAPDPVEVLTVVQWQDALGGWHDVEGWRGRLDEVTGALGRKVWWLPQALFAQGPFRWRIYRASDGALLAQSAPFDLPARVGEIVWVEVALAP